MPLIKGLYTALGIVTGVNAITSLYFFWPRESTSEPESVEPNKNNSIWTWKDTIWFFVMIVATILLVSVALFSFWILKTRFLMSVIIISCFLGQIARSIPSAGTVGNIVSGKASKILGINDYISLITLALVVSYANIYGILDKVIEYVDRQTNTILSDWTLLGFYVASIAITTFFICSLALKPLKIIIVLLRKVCSRFSNQKASLIFDKLKKQVNGKCSTKTLTVSLIEYSIKQHTIFCCLLRLGVPIAVALDIFRMTVLFAYGLVVSIVWDLMCIILSSEKLIAKIASWILSLSDRNVVAISFRIAVILGFGCTVIINQYQPFLKDKETTAVFEFISSTIIIPVILEWILSYKDSIKSKN